MSFKKILIAASVFAFGAFAFSQESDEKFVLVNGGTYTIGSVGFESNESPVTEVSLLPFYILKTEVSQKTYREVTGHNFSNNKNALNPVEEVSWYDAVIFCNKLSVKEGLTPCYSLSGKSDPDSWGAVPRINDPEALKSYWNTIVCDFNADGYRLPTEAEWEVAASYAGNADYSDLSSYAWFAENSEKSTHETGVLSENSFGLFDMNGNVWEWCQDWYGWYKDDNANTDNSATVRKIRRGGSFLSDSVFCRNENRASSEPSLRGIDLGFRIVKKAPVLDSAVEENSLDDVQADFIDLPVEDDSFANVK